MHSAMDYSGLSVFEFQVLDPKKPPRAFVWASYDDEAFDILRGDLDIWSNKALKLLRRVDGAEAQALAASMDIEPHGVRYA